ncbi:MAG TPA: class I SAM-dependent methyltransferase [Magnetospirillaceae bacterium]|nr:class I SAM-dependent methyltransferase [Magnetospirillaceae bacterium]
MTADNRPSATERWENLHRQPRFRPRYPHEQVVRWTFGNLPRRAGEQPPRVLDLGCGAGRHALFLAAEGYEAYASDISRSGLDELQKTALARGLVVRTELTSDLSCYKPVFFDAVISFGVLYYMSYEAATACIAAVHRILKPGGKFLCVTRTDQDGRRHDAIVQPAPFTWRLGGLSTDAPSDAEAGMDMLFLPRSQIERMVSMFARTTIDRMSYRHGDFIDDDWVVSAEKSAL